MEDAHLIFIRDEWVSRRDNHITYRIISSHRIISHHVTSYHIVSYRVISTLFNASHKHHTVHNLKYHDTHACDFR